MASGARYGCHGYLNVTANSRRGPHGGCGEKVLVGLHLEDTYAVKIISAVFQSSLERL